MMSSSGTPGCVVRGAAVIHGRGLLGRCQLCPVAAESSCAVVRGRRGIRSQQRGRASLVPCLPQLLLAPRPPLGSTRGLTCFQQISSCFSGQSPFCHLPPAALAVTAGETLRAAGLLERRTGGWGAEKQTLFLTGLEARSLRSGCRRGRFLAADGHLLGVLMWRRAHHSCLFLRGHGTGTTHPPRLSMRLH